jgi:hypothetical protein
VVQVQPEAAVKFEDRKRRGGKFVLRVGGWRGKKQE